MRGGKAPLEALAAGHSVIAPVCAAGRSTLGVDSYAANDHTLVRSSGSGNPPRDVTVNRAFSRRFFEALDQAAPASGSALAQREMSSPMETLDEADLIAEDEEALDESDLIQP